MSDLAVGLSTGEHLIDCRRERFFPPFSLFLSVLPFPVCCVVVFFFALLLCYIPICNYVLRRIYMKIILFDVKGGWVELGICCRMTTSVVDN